MSITEQQWNRLNDEQKKLFQEEVGEEFNDKIYPKYNDILIFLGNNGLEIGFKSLGDEETPPAIKNTDELWNEVITYFTNKK